MQVRKNVGPGKIQNLTLYRDLRKAVHLKCMKAYFLIEIIADERDLSSWASWAEHCNWRTKAFTKVLAHA